MRAGGRGAGEGEGCVSEHVAPSRVYTRYEREKTKRGIPGCAPSPFLGAFPQRTNALITDAGDRLACDAVYFFRKHLDAFPRVEHVPRVRFQSLEVLSYALLHFAFFVALVSESTSAFCGLDIDI